VTASQGPAAGGGVVASGTAGVVSLGSGDAAGGSAGAVGVAVAPSPASVEGAGSGLVVGGAVTVRERGALPGPTLPAASVWNAVILAEPGGRDEPEQLQAPPETAVEHSWRSRPADVTANTSTVEPFSPVP